MPDLAEQMNQISEALFGYREARHAEIMSRISFLVDFERDSDAGNALKGARVRDLVRQLNAEVNPE